MRNAPPNVTSVKVRFSPPPKFPAFFSLVADEEVGTHPGTLRNLYFLAKGATDFYFSQPDYFSEFPL